MNLIDIAHKPVIEVSTNDMVIEAVDRSIGPRVGAVVVVDHGQMVGVITERDVMFKVVHGRLDPLITKVGDVMSAPPIYVHPKGTVEEILRLMSENHIRHLPLSEDGRTALAMLSIRNVLHWLLEDTKKYANHLEAYMSSGMAQ